MDSIRELLKKQIPKEKACLYRWQDLAKEIISKIATPVEKHASIFRCCKVDQHSAKFALLDCIETGHTNFNYFFKMWSIIRKSIKM